MISLRTRETVAVDLFLSEFHLFHNFVIFNDIDFKFSAAVDNNISFDLKQ